MPLVSEVIGKSTLNLVSYIPVWSDFCNILLKQERGLRYKYSSRKLKFTFCI